MLVARLSPLAALLEAGWSRWSDVAARVIEVAPVEGKPASWSRDGIEVELHRLPHGPARTNPENLAHVIRLGERTLVPVGDAEARPDQLTPAGLTGRRFDVGLLPYWFWQEQRFRPALATLTGRRGSIALHVPPDEAGRALAGVADPPVVSRPPLDAIAF